jgi:hypothetical protein
MKGMPVRLAAICRLQGISLDFKNEKFLYVKDQLKIMRDWMYFVDSGLNYQKFTRRLYDCLVQGKGFHDRGNIAMFKNRYFQDLSGKLEFINGVLSPVVPIRRYKRVRKVYNNVLDSMGQYLKFKLKDLIETLKKEDEDESKDFPSVEVG